MTRFGPLVPQHTFHEKSEAPARRRVLILGSTGSIGKTTLSLINDYPEQFELFGLVAGSRTEDLILQAIRQHPRFLGIGDPIKRTELKNLCADRPIEVVAGEEEIAHLATHPDVEVVVAAIVGSSGVRSVLAALEAGKIVALANKESLVAAGPLIAAAMQKSPHSRLIPVDSEHSALFQCMQGLDFEEVESVVLTASGGPFLNMPAHEQMHITPEQAVLHPRWNMGAKISVDSATLMNKALEMIEAHWLFGLPSERIEVVIHPQSIVHSLVRTIDGGMLAQLSAPDMRAPIAHALTYPYRRLPRVLKHFDLTMAERLEFRAVDSEQFRAPELARLCMEISPAMSAVLNAANEKTVDAFLKQQVRFPDIMNLNEWSLERFAGREFNNFDELLSLQEEVKTVVEERIKEQG